MHSHLGALATLLALTLAHMELTSPAPFNSSANPHRRTRADPYLQYPYDCCGPGARWTYPCRGYLPLLGTLEGAPTATWPAGSQQNWSISGIGNHYGGSCQVGFSADRGESFRVATSNEGNCPHRKAGNGPEGQVFNFTVPSDLPPGVQVFAWTWYNREQEFNMNCGAVNITSPSRASDPFVSAHETAKNCTCTCPAPTNISTCACTCPADLSTGRRSEIPDYAGQRAEGADVAFHDRPEMLVADVGTGCITPKTTAELNFPQPGSDVVASDGEYPMELPSGPCRTVAYSSGG
ncbi:hypothetical protein B0A48_09990 [Cryoendolithus antarcticus]|uniref:Chitin-binding type-4 domain-containing protein n=1 Tax=Cryoendolithus antarcticus TaxID=1507870 RepID=A0A1V8T3L8_9PEZI|nr:hypothetical protein B0A48_09990 [Cryoendolithus antarcticus]